MSQFIVHDGDGIDDPFNGRILRSGSCPKFLIESQSEVNEFAMEGTGDDRTQKIKEGKVVDKTLEEIEVDNPTRPLIPDDEKMKHIKKKDWDSILSRLELTEHRLDELENPL